MANYKDIKYEFPTSAITSGTLADARISESSVTQHVSAVDVQGIKSDVTALALREATNESSAAFNLPNSFIETFTDDTNLGTETDGDRSAGMWATIYTANVNQPFYRTSSDGWTFTTASAGNITVSTGHTVVAWLKTTNGTSWLTDGSTAGALFDFATNSSSRGYFLGTQGSSTVHDSLSMHEPGSQSAVATDTLTSTASLTEWVLCMWRADAGTWTGATQFKIINPASSYGSLTAMTYGTTQASWNGIANSADAALFYTPITAARWGGYATSWLNKDIATIGHWKEPLTDAEVIALANGGVLFDWDSNKGDYTSSSGLLDYFKIYDSDGTSTTMLNSGTGTRNATKQTGSGAWQATDDGLPKSVSGTSSTGTLIQTANTVASAQTKVGGTILYKDNAGTNTLGTDLKIYFTCNGGTNWTEAASYNAVTPVYSTGIKMVRLGETTCTSGTDIRYKAVYANQSATSKEAELHGIGINY